MPLITPCYRTKYNTDVLGSNIHVMYMKKITFVRLPQVCQEGYCMITECTKEKINHVFFVNNKQRHCRPKIVLFTRRILRSLLYFSREITRSPGNFRKFQKFRKFRKMSGGFLRENSGKFSPGFSCIFMG